MLQKYLRLENVPPDHISDLVNLMTYALPADTSFPNSLGKKETLLFRSKKPTFLQLQFQLKKGLGGLATPNYALPPIPGISICFIQLLALNQTMSVRLSASKFNEVSTKVVTCNECNAM